MNEITPPAEAARLAALQAYNILDTATEQDYEELTELAAAICGTPIALISFVDQGRQWFKSHRGLDISQTERSQSFCARAILNPTELMQVEDARTDERFKDNPLVTGAPHIAFYAGMPLVDHQGHALGSLCVIDRQRRQLTPEQQSALRTLAKQVVSKLELRRKNNLLAESERRLNQMIATTPVGQCIIRSRDLIIEVANQPMLNIWNKTRGEVIERKLMDVFPEVADQPYPQLLRQVFDTAAPVSRHELPTELHQPDGSTKIFYTNFNYEPLFDAGGRVEAIMATVVDVTETVKARKMLEQSDENFRLTIEAAKLGLYNLDLATGLVTVNEYCRDIFGFDKLVVPASEGFKMMAEDEMRINHAMNDAIQSGQVFDQEYRVIRHTDGEMRWVHSVGRVLQNDTGQKVNFYGTMADITRQKAEEQRKMDFIGIVSHELRTPLTSLNGYVQMLGLKAGKAGDQSFIDIAAKARRQVDRMSGLISGFLDVARLGESRIQINCKGFDMAGLIRTAEEESMATISSHTIVYHPVEHTPVNADKDKIEQVLINFINNAVKYSPHGSTINVACITRNGKAHVSVTDEGMGIAPKEQPHVFNRFYRVGGSETKTISGFGIGLYICKEIIELHGGQIGVESVLHKGSVFWFELPVDTTAVCM